MNPFNEFVVLGDASEETLGSAGSKTDPSNLHPLSYTL